MNERKVGRIEFDKVAPGLVPATASREDNRAGCRKHRQAGHEGRGYRMKSGHKGRRYRAAATMRS